MLIRALPVVFCLIPFFSGVAAAVSPSELSNAFQRGKEYEGIVDMSNKFADSMKAEAEKTYGNFKKDVLPQIKKWQDKIGYENGKIIFNADKKKGKGEKEVTKKAFLAKDERIYIFISSSMPGATLTAYAASAAQLKDPNIIMVMRGCVGGCNKFMPTANFIRGIVAPSEESQYPVEVQIDPYLYHMYKVETVPSIIYARNVTVQDKGSEGLQDNLKSIPTALKVQGDVSLQYAIESFNRKAGNPRLAAMLAEMRKTWHQKDAK